ncbi:hypothetical protein DSL72_001325 [Monilinia vaccinii-corymbosi]|uniref:Uncharacterized protein n=1 Tax=Monilinia vaccinii-corymbosi TaxID=61207 RepID=A0A8A3PAK4_9HELO|nr:hypothetical protein DSL72_001325 [Monilinia vaccinii-corymbosi]
MLIAQPDARRIAWEVHARIEEAHAVHQRAGPIHPKELRLHESPIGAREAAAFARGQAASEQREQRDRKDRDPDGDDAQCGLVAVAREQELDEEGHACAGDARRSRDQTEGHPLAHDPPLVEHADDGVDEAVHAGAEGAGDEAEDAQGEAEPDLVGLVAGEAFGEGG